MTFCTKAQVTRNCHKQGVSSLAGALQAVAVRLRLHARPTSCITCCCKPTTKYSAVRKGEIFYLLRVENLRMPIIVSSTICTSIYPADTSGTGQSTRGISADICSILALQDRTQQTHQALANNRNSILCRTKKALHQQETACMCSTLAAEDGNTTTNHTVCLIHMPMLAHLYHSTK